MLPGTLTPSLAEDAALLGSRIPFTPAAELIGRFRKVEVSEATVRRVSENSGHAWVELQREEAKALELELKEAREGPALQQLSVDGAMVPLLHGEWAEVKTMAIGTIGERGTEGEAHAREMSYFSRMRDHQSFARLAMVETHRRGTESAGRVCAVVDGAEWQQKFIDLHRPDAVRILDWCHAAEYLARASQAAFGSGTGEASEWLGRQLHELKHGEPERLLENLRELGRELGEGAALKTVKTSLEYLEKRREQIRYAQFQAAGYPIGSGAVESANKLVVEQRLKGSGMHWLGRMWTRWWRCERWYAAAGGRRRGLKSAESCGNRPRNARSSRTRRKSRRGRERPRRQTPISPVRLPSPLRSSAAQHRPGCSEMPSPS